MNKKILVGLSIFGIAAGFWACGDGSIEAKSGDDELALANYGEFNPEGMANLVQGAMSDCEADPACQAKMEGSTYVPPPEQPPEGGEENPGSSGDQTSPDGGSSNSGGNTNPGSNTNPTVSSSSAAPNTNPTVSSSSSAPKTNPTVSSSSTQQQQTQSSSSQQQTQPSSSSQTSASSGGDCTATGGETTKDLVGAYDLNSGSTSLDAGTYIFTCSGSTPVPSKVRCSGGGQVDVCGKSIDIEQYNFTEVVGCGENKPVKISSTLKCAASSW